MRSTVAVMTVLLALVPFAASGQDHVVDETPIPQFLFVLSGTAGFADGNRLTIEGVARLSISATGRPGSPAISA